MTDTASRPVDPAAEQRRREAIVRRYWLNGDLTPLSVANSLAGQKVLQPA